MSIVNLMASDVWSEADIVGRTEAMISSQFSCTTTMIINRKVTAASIGLYLMSVEEKKEVEKYSNLCISAAIAGNLARSDMALLHLVIDHEVAETRLLALKITDPETVTVVDAEGVESEQANPAISVDASERKVAQATINSSSKAVVELVAARKPVVVDVEVFAGNYNE
jgi:hypothetical protein